MLKSLALLLKLDPRLLMETDDSGLLPVNYAICRKSSIFYQALIHQYLDSVWVRSLGGRLPVHNLCFEEQLDTVKHLVEIYPESVHKGDTSGCLLSLHKSAWKEGKEKDSIIKYLLQQDSTCASNE